MRLVSIIAVLWVSSAATAFADDPHAEMAAALAAQADLHPTPVMLPTHAAAPLHAASQSAVRRGLPDAAARAAAQAQSPQATSQALAHQAQASAAAAAGQAQAQAAKQRVGSHPHH